MIQKFVQLYTDNKYKLRDGFHAIKLCDITYKGLVQHALFILQDSICRYLTSEAFTKAYPFRIFDEGIPSSDTLKEINYAYNETSGTRLFIVSNSSRTRFWYVKIPYNKGGYNNTINRIKALDSNREDLSRKQIDACMQYCDYIITNLNLLP